MIIVSLYGQPSAGKSTSAAQIFAKLKNSGANVELVDEFAKKLVYAKRNPELANQIYVFAKQYKRLADLEAYEKVPMVITDSALLLGLLYCDKVPYKEELVKLIWKVHHSYENINVLVKRVKPYNPSGRTQTEQESEALIPRLESLGVKWDYVINGDEAGQLELADILLAKYGKRIKI